MIVATFGAVQTITAGVLAFFALIAVVTILRVVLRRESSAWRGLRIGFFIERDRDDAPTNDEDGPGGG